MKVSVWHSTASMFGFWICKLGGIFDDDDALLSGIASASIRRRVVFPVQVPPLMSSVFPLRICSAKKLSKRPRQRAASDKVIDGVMAAGKLPDRKCGRRPHDRRNDRRQAASVRELRVQDGVVFVELFAKLVGDHFEAGAELAGVEGNVLSRCMIPSRSYHHEASGLPMISLMLSSSSSGSMGRRNGRINSKLMAGISQRWKPSGSPGSRE